MKKFIALIMIVIMIMSCSACAEKSTANPETNESISENITESSSANIETAADDVIEIGYAVNNYTNPYYFGIMDGGNFAAEKLGCKVVWKSCENSIEEEITIIENFIESGVDCICMDPVDATALVDVINEAEKAGIPVVTFNNILDDVDCWAYTPNTVTEATHIAEMMCAYLDYSGNVCILQEQPGNQSSDSIENAYRDVMAKYGGIRIVGEQITNWDPDKALEITQTWLSTLDQIDAIITVSGNSAASAAQAIAAANMTGEIGIFSVDGMNNELITEGGATADTSSYTLVAGYWNIVMCYELAQDTESWPKVSRYSSPLTATKENYDMMVSNGLLENDPTIEVITADEAIANASSDDPSTLMITWDEGCGPHNH